MKKNSISEFEMEKQDFKIKLKRGLNGGGPANQNDDPQSMGYAVQMAPQSIPLAISAPSPVATSSDLEIRSPMIGTLYRAPSPEAASYVEIGTEVNPDTVVCIIEAMKVMNEIKAEAKGIITQVVVENAKPVEFGQPMFKLRPT